VSDISLSLNIQFSALVCQFSIVYESSFCVLCH